MSSIIEQRLKKYAPSSVEAEEGALKEILQEIILCGLSNAGFFENAMFQGGTALRIFHNLARFSEDLDFILKIPNADFRWEPFLKSVENFCEEYGIEPEIFDKTRAGNAVQRTFLKDNSIVKILNLSFHHSKRKKLTIKLEIDTDPPMGSIPQVKILDFPLISEVLVQDLSSGFAGKSHALLCRKYLKGRDWYDFLWYVSQGILPNLVFLSNGIHQQGPWVGQKIEVTSSWYLGALEEKIQMVDWKQAIDDVAPFLYAPERQSLKLWGIPLFLERVEKLKKAFGHPP